ncbi:CxC2 domain-containing protein [Mycena indigotica]|uniref:CxC2 domain-containing protein n=1 Tax=Mycena indigotica TaxID=2126181 RepID=A0A8H6SDC0_9AGAR|nr:CxC2 domain-containing protein [Mycena indigotica]KAF7296857.1 CxC2 domain-containing protein [Mycena indigotica]
MAPLPRVPTARSSVCSSFSQWDARKRLRETTSTFVFNNTGPNPSADLSFHVMGHSNTMASVANVAPQKRVRLEDDISTEDLYSEFEGTASLETSELVAIADTLSTLDSDNRPAVFQHFIEDYDVPTSRTRYESSDDPMAIWRRRKHIFLDNLLRQDGLGDYALSPSCSLCNAAHEPDTMRLFRCQECGVHLLQCLSCLKERHADAPLHVVKEWNNNFWEPVALHRIHLKDTSKQSLRLEYQLGHHGKPCPLPRSSLPLVVIDTNGVFTLDVRLCGCSRSLSFDLVGQLMGNGWYPATSSELGTCATFRALDLFRMLNVVGNVNAHDFVGSLQRLTDPTLLGQTPDRYRAFSRMARQYAFLRRVKHAGIGYERGWNAEAEAADDGTVEVATVAPGLAAVECWACPRPGFNLPSGWENCKPEDEFLYALMLALDANFRLKNRIRANERQDCSLGPGWSYFVDEGPYKEHLRDYVAEEDVSTCIAFAALMQKETRLTTGLRVSGVGGCVCARHGIVRAGGLGDLQKGERYANMDYILMHALRNAKVKQLVLSYDIACQWKVRLWERVICIESHSNMPANLDDFRIEFALPVWHAAAHEETCQATYSLNYAVGVGRTDGEGIERTWAVLNPISFATKEMSQGNRHDTIDDKVDHVNFEKNVQEGVVLARKLLIAVAEREKQVGEFLEVDDSLDPDVWRIWMQKVKDWLADKTKPNPYLMAADSVRPSEAQVAAKLKEAELEEAREGRGDSVEGPATATAFVKGLLQLENMKRRIKNELRGDLTLTANRTGQIQELRVSLLKKIKNIQAPTRILHAGGGWMAMGGGAMP